MIGGLKHTSRMALLNSFLLIGRRISLLYIAMFIFQNAWLHICLYMITNMLFLAYLVALMPFESSLMNRLRIFNECTSLIIAYLIAIINDIRYGPETNVKIGELMIYTLFASWTINLLLVVLTSLKSTYLYIRRYHNRCMHKRKRQFNAV